MAHFHLVCGTLNTPQGAIVNTSTFSCSCRLRGHVKVSLESRLDIHTLWPPQTQPTRYMHLAQRRYCFMLCWEIIRCTTDMTRPEQIQPCQRLVIKQIIARCANRELPPTVRPFKCSNVPCILRQELLSMTRRHRMPQLNATAVGDMPKFVCCTVAPSTVLVARKQLTPQIASHDRSHQLCASAAPVVDEARSAVARGRHSILRRRRLRGRRIRRDSSTAGQVRRRPGRRPVLYASLPCARLPHRVVPARGRRGEAQQRPEWQSTSGQSHGQMSPAAAGGAHGPQHPHAGQWCGHSGPTIRGAGPRSGLEWTSGWHSQDDARLSPRGEVRAAGGRRLDTPPRSVADGHAQGQPRVGGWKHHQGRAKGQTGCWFLHED